MHPINAIMVTRMLTRNSGLGSEVGSIPFGSVWWFVYAGLSCFFVLFAGIMSGLTLGLMSLGLVDLEILQRSGSPTEKKQAALILPVVQKQHQLLVTLLLCNAAAMEALPIYLDKLFNQYVAIILSVTFVLFFAKTLRLREANFTSSNMGMVFGKIRVETPKYKVLQSTIDYEIRQYPPSVIAQLTYHPSQMKGDKDGGFSVLANYIGAFGNPQNTKPEKIAMTAPVITKSSGEKIAMTAPVVTKTGGAEDEKKMVTMEFLLPSKYEKAEEAPRPVDERVVIREEGERKYGVVTFRGRIGKSLL